MTDLLAHLRTARRATGLVRRLLLIHRQPCQAHETSGTELEETLIGLNR